MTSSFNIYRVIIIIIFLLSLYHIRTHRFIWKIIIIFKRFKTIIKTLVYNIFNFYINKVIVIIIIIIDFFGKS